MKLLLVTTEPHKLEQLTMTLATATCSITVTADLQTAYTQNFDLIIINQPDWTEAQWIIQVQKIITHQNQTRQLIKIGALQLDLLKQKVTYNRQPLTLPHRQYSLLLYFVTHPDCIITRSTIMKEVWDLEITVWSNTLEAHICELRKELQAVTGKKYIHTISGRGYKFRSVT